MKEGWICPKCGKVLAPWVPECDCYRSQTNSQYSDTQQLNTLREFHVNPVYEPAPYWTNPDWKAPVPMCTVSNVHGFTDEERDLYWKTIQKKSVATGVNINDLFKADDKSEDK